MVGALGFRGFSDASFFCLKLGEKKKTSYLYGVFVAGVIRRF